MPEKKRTCSFSSEKELELFEAYSYNNCVLECFIKTVTSSLNCLPWFLPRFNNTQGLVACDPWDTTKFIKVRLGLCSGPRFSYRHDHKKCWQERIYYYSFRAWKPPLYYKDTAKGKKCS